MQNQQTENNSRSTNCDEHEEFVHKNRAQVAYIPATALVPKTWEDWFWSLISDSAPFSWGDTDGTLVTVDRFVDHVARCLDDCDELYDPDNELAEENKAFWVQMQNRLLHAEQEGLLINLEA